MSRRDSGSGAAAAAATSSTPLLAADHTRGALENERKRAASAGGNRGGRKASVTTAKSQAAVAHGGDWSYLVDNSTEAPQSAQEKSKWSTMKKFVRKSAAAIDEGPTSISDESVEIAAMYLKDAMHGRGIGYRVDAAARRVYRLFHARWWVVTYLLVACLDMALVMLEKPTVPSELWFGEWLPVLLESLCIVVYICDLILLYRFFLNGYEKTRFWCHKWSLVRVIVIGLMVVDIGLSLATDYSTIRFARPLRPLMIIGRTRNVRQVFLGCLITLYRILPMFLLIAFHIAFFSFIGTVIFGGLTSSTLFATLPSSVSTLWRTTTSTPVNLDIITGYWSTSAWSSLFVVSFLVIGNLILMKLFIASSFRSYKQYTRRKTMSRVKKRRVALNAAFKLLALRSRRHSDAKAVAKDTWFRVMRHLRKSLNDEVLEVMFAAVDTEGHGEVDVRAFMNLCALISVKFRMHPDIPGWPRLNAWRRTGRIMFNYSVYLANERIVVADLCVGLLVILSGCQMYEESQLAHESTPHPGLAHAWHATGVVTLILFLAEGASRAVCFGLKRYFDSWFHILDVACNVCGVVYFLLVAADPNPNSPSSTYRLVLNVVLVFRLLRLLKLLAVFSPTKKIMWTLQRVAPSMGRLLFIIVTVFYGFAIVGVDLYQAYPGPKGYEDELTFSSFPAAMLSLFEVSMLSSWPMVMGVEQAHTDRWSQVFFYLFRVITVMLLLPVFIGFIVETFVTNYAQVEAEFKKEESEVQARHTRWREEQKRRKERREQRSKSRIKRSPLVTSVPNGSAGAPAGATALVTTEGDGSMSDSGDSTGFNYEEEAAIEMAIRRRTSDVNYVMFDVTAALQQADYEKLLEQHKAHVAELARKQERIEHMASKLLSQSADIRRLEEECQQLRVTLSRGAAGRAVTRFRRASALRKGGAGGGAEIKTSASMAAMVTSTTAAASSSSGTRRNTAAGPRGALSKPTKSARRRSSGLMDVMYTAQAAAVVATTPNPTTTEAQPSQPPTTGGEPVSPARLSGSGNDGGCARQATTPAAPQPRRHAPRSRSHTDVGALAHIDHVLNAPRVQRSQSPLPAFVEEEAENGAARAARRLSGASSTSAAAAAAAAASAASTQESLGLSASHRHGVAGAGLGMRVAGHDAVWHRATSLRQAKAGAEGGSGGVSGDSDAARAAGGGSGTRNASGELQSHERVRTRGEDLRHGRTGFAHLHSDEEDDAS